MLLMPTWVFILGTEALALFLMVFRVGKHFPNLSVLVVAEVWVTLSPSRGKIALLSEV